MVVHVDQLLSFSILNYVIYLMHCMIHSAYYTIFADVN